MQILDPACGTGTFLHAVVARIREHFADSPGLWPGYVAEHLLPRIYGFELLMAPYAVAHMKLGLQLKDSGYDFASAERLRVYLTNTLEEAHELSGLPLFANYIAQEAASAGEVKRDGPIMVVLGNPPYSGNSANNGEWIANLLRGVDTSTQQKAGNYFSVDGGSLGERNPKWLNDDYVKFIRFAQWRIEQTGHGVLAFITNHGYLDNPTFRGMRASLMDTFDELYLYDLHGNSKKKEKAPDGGKDENVFDIMQGVAIGIFVKRAPAAKIKASVIPAQAGIQTKQKSRAADNNCTVHHADLYGTRASKYAALAEQDVTSTHWKILQPQSPAYLFAQQDALLLAEYEQSLKITDIMPLNVLGFQTHRDGFAIDFERAIIEQRMSDMRDVSISDAQCLEKYALTDNRDWQIASARQRVQKDEYWQRLITPCAYRPFDNRWSYFDEAAIDRPRRELKDHVLNKENLCLNLTRKTGEADWRNVLVSDLPAPAVYVEIKEGSSVFPLYLYPREKQDLLDDAPQEKRANFSAEFLAALHAKLGDLPLTPEEVFVYLYAVLYAPAYRSRYAEFLKRDFPRIPLTADRALFQKLAALGQQLIGLHLLHQHAPAICRYPIAGSNRMDKVEYRNHRVYINAEQFFDGVPEAVWGYHIGGYQVAAKWLKDRKGRLLSFDDLQHYQRVIAALARTIALQAEIDAAIPGWPLQ